jgi:hypothetical protein
MHGWMLHDGGGGAQTWSQSVVSASHSKRWKRATCRAGSVERRRRWMMRDDASQLPLSPEMVDDAKTGGAAEMGESRPP